jgi:hypothetical protein
MAERIIGKVRIAGIDFADVITSAPGIAAASWEAQALTLRDDEVSIIEADATEEELLSHENDTPEDVDYYGGATTIAGAFIKQTYAQLVATLGGTITGTGENAQYMRAAKKLVLNKAVRFRLKGGGSIIIPNAKGVVQLHMNVGFGGVSKYPFRFRPLASAIKDTNDDPVDIIFE